MSSSNSRPNRSTKDRLSQYVKPPRAPETSPTSSYFGSKLFRGKSTGNASKYLNTLRDLNTLKAKHSLHSLTYSELCKLIPTDTTVTSPHSNTSPKNQTATFSNFKDNYSVLSPEFIQEDLPQKKGKPAPPSQQRQILINHFLTQTEETRIKKPFNTLEHVWHQTLSSPERQPMSSLRTPIKANKTTFLSMMKDSTISVQVDTSKDESIAAPANRERKDSSNYLLKNPEEEDKNRNMIEEDYYACASNQMEFLATSLKDFHKVLSHTQQSYQKTQSEQANLTDFVSTFIKEVEQIEKTPKALNMSRLNLCVTSLETKVEDLTAEKDLIVEQLERIHDIISTPEVRRDTFLSGQPWSGVKSPGEFLSLDDTRHFRTNSTFSNQARPSVGNNEELDLPFNMNSRSSFRDISAISTLQTKTKMLKSDVQKLQTERKEFHRSLRASKVKFSKLNSRNGSEQIILKIAKDPMESPKSPKTPMSYKLSKDGSPFLEGLKPPADLFQLNEPTSRTNELSARSEEEEKNRDSLKKSMKYHREIDLADDEEKLRKLQGNGSELGAVLHCLYESILIGLEGSVTKKVREMKVFQKDVDDSYESDTKLLKSQIKECFENLVTEFQNLTHNFDIHVRYFLEAIEENYKRFLSLAESNLLKLTSVKNIVAASVEKLKKLEKLTTTYTQLDLTDKMLRKEYDTDFRALKQEIQSDKQTLLFLVEQFDKSVSIYCIDPLENLNVQEVTKLLEQSKMLVKVVYNLEKFPSLEQEFNEKSTKAYKKCKETTVLIEYLKEFRSTREIISSEEYRKTEESLRLLENLLGRVYALQNEMKMISKLLPFQDLAVKPLLIVVKLVKKMETQQKELKALLENIKEDLITDYNEFVHRSEILSSQLESHIRRIGSNGEHLNFLTWSQNYQVIENLREEIIQVMVGITKYVEAKYPQSIPLMPSPQDKKFDLESLQKITDCLLRILATGRMFENWAECETFTGFKTNKLKEKLNQASQQVQEEIKDKERAIVELGNNSEYVKKLANEVLQILFQLRYVMNNSFELEDRMAQEYEGFEENNFIKEVNLLGSSQVPENQKVRYPRLMTSQSIDKYDFLDVLKKENTSPSITVESEQTPISPKGKTFKRQITVGLVKSLPGTESSGEYSNKMNGFIEKIKWVFEDFYKSRLAPCTSYHPFFKEILGIYKTMGSEEVQLLEQTQRAVHNVHVNHLFYNKEIRPLTNVHKYLHALNNWSSKVGNLNIIRESMKACLDAIKALEGEPILRGRVAVQIVKYKQIQSMVSNSVNIVIDLLSFGTWLNEKDITGLLGHSLRIEDGPLAKYVRVFERSFQSLYNSYKSNSELLEEDTSKLLENLQDFLEKLLGILKLAQMEYSNLFRVTSDGLKPHEGHLFGYVEQLYNGMKNFADEFCDRLNQISMIAAKPTWLVRILDNFYRAIVLKDLGVFCRLYEEGQKLTEFLREFKEEFIGQEIKKEAKYKHINTSDPTHCDRQIERCNAFSKVLNDFLTSEEVLCRPELKNTLSTKLKEVQAMKKVFTFFAVIYSMGRKLDDNVNVLVSKTTVPEIYELVVKLDNIVRDILNHLFKEVEGIRALDKDTIQLSIGVNLESILKTEVLAFYNDCNKCIGELKEYLGGISQFYYELKRKYKNQVLLLRDDWVEFIKDWVSAHFGSLTKRVHMVESDYPEFKEKLIQFLKELEAKIKRSKYVFLETMKRVEYLNEYFFNEWFFNFSEEEKDVADKLLPRMKKIIKNIKQPKYKTATKLRQKLKKISDQVERCDKCIKELANQNFIKGIFDGIKGWNVVAEYHGRKNIGKWKQLIDFAIIELISLKENQQQPAQGLLKEIPETAEDLYNYVEQQLKCTLTDIQKDFLEAIYNVPLQ